MMVRGEIIDEFPDEVKKKIDGMIENHFSAKDIHDWLSVNMFPEWKTNHPEWCVTKKTVQNYYRLKVPEKRLLHPSYVHSAMRRTHEDIDVLDNIGETVRELGKLIKSLKEKGTLDNKDIGELRRLHKEFRDSNKILFDLRSRLGLIKEEPKKFVQFSFSKKLEELKEEREKEKSEEEKLYEKVVEKKD